MIFSISREVYEHLPRRKEVQKEIQEVGDDFSIVEPTNRLRENENKENEV